MYRVGEFISLDGAQMGESALCFGSISFVLESLKWRCEQKNGMNGMGCTGEGDETSKAMQSFRLHHRTYNELYIQFFELLEANAV